VALVKDRYKCEECKRCIICGKGVIATDLVRGISAKFSQIPLRTWFEETLSEILELIHAGAGPITLLYSNGYLF
jgi:hypothetical protein